MNQVGSFQQFSDLIARFRAEHAEIFTNCFMLPEEARGYIHAGRMRYVLAKDDLLFDVSQDDYDRLFYFTASFLPVTRETLVPGLGANRPLVLDLVERGDAVATERSIKQKWEPCGFTLHCVYERYAATGLGIRLKEPNGTREEAVEAPTGYRFNHSDVEKTDEILALWRRCLVPLSIALPAERELAELIRQGRVTCATDERGTVCAALLANRQGKRATIQHVCVRPDHRRQGLARFLLAASMRADRLAGVESWRLWVDRKNLPAIRLYAGIGFTPDGTIAKQLIFQPTCMES